MFPRMDRGSDAREALATLEEAGHWDRRGHLVALTELVKLHARAVMAELADVVERAATAAMGDVVAMVDMVPQGR